MICSKCDSDVCIKQYIAGRDARGNLKTKAFCLKCRREMRDKWRVSIPYFYVPGWSPSQLRSWNNRAKESRERISRRFV